MTGARENFERLLSEEVGALTNAGQRICRAFASGNSLHDTDFRALVFIHLNGRWGHDVTPAMIGAHLSLSSAAVTYLVDRLERAGYVQRVPDPQDRRRVILRYCDCGRELTDGFFERVKRYQHEALTVFDDDELETAHRVIQAINHALVEYHDELNQAFADDKLEVESA